MIFLARSTGQIQQIGQIYFITTITTMYDMLLLQEIAWFSIAISIIRSEFFTFEFIHTQQGNSVQMYRIAFFWKKQRYDFQWRKRSI